MRILAHKHGLGMFMLITVATLCFIYYILMLTQTSGLLDEYTNNSRLLKVQNLLHLQRYRILRRMCNNFYVKTSKHVQPIKSFDHIIVDDKHKLLYCYVPKVASTNWKRVMLVLTKNLGQQPLDIPANHSHKTDELRTLSSFTPSEIRYKLKNYFKFLFVRHPFERLVSAFRNKFEKNYSTYFQNRFGRIIIQRYRLHPSKKSLALGHDVLFTEFVDYLLDPKTKQMGPLNEHWRPSWLLCDPCHIHYDVIGKYETLEKDAEFILHSANVSHLVSFPKVIKTTYTSDIMRNYLQNLTNYKFMALFNMYALDFRLFDYHYRPLPAN